MYKTTCYYHDCHDYICSRYAITATAYRWVRDRNESQCIVITGENFSCYRLYTVADLALIIMKYHLQIGLPRVNEVEHVLSIRKK